MKPTPYAAHRAPMPRRDFITQTALGAASIGAAGLIASATGLAAQPKPSPATRRVGAVAYNFHYSIGLFAHKDREGSRMDPAQFLEAVHQGGGNLIQFFGPTLSALDDAALHRLRARAEELNLGIEVHGGQAQSPLYVDLMERAAKLGSKIIGCNFGILLRPDKITTLDAWKTHMQKCEARLRELIPHAKRLGLVIGVEDHLDFTLEDLHSLITKIDSPQVGVFFDVGNWLGTLDDPVEAAEVLGPLIVATHYKDFAVEETPSGFQLTMVPFGSGSLDLTGVTAALLQRMRPETNLTVEMICGQQLNVPWLEPRFWPLFPNKSPAQVAATLHHIRRQKVNHQDVRSMVEFTTMSHAERLPFEFLQNQRCIEYLWQLLRA